MRIKRSPDYVSVVWADDFGRWHARVTDGPTARRRAVAAIRAGMRDSIGTQEPAPGYRMRVEITESKQLRACQVIGQVIYREAD